MKKPKNTPSKTVLATVEPVKAVQPVKVVEPVKMDSVRADSVEKTAAKPEAPKPKPARVVFELVKPDAKNVYVAGSFNDWKPELAPLTPLGNGRWEGDLTLKPGRHEYLFVVDGEWLPDPNAKESVQNPFGGRNSILGVSE